MFCGSSRWRSRLGSPHRQFRLHAGDRFGAKAWHLGQVIHALEWAVLATKLHNGLGFGRADALDAFQLLLAGGVQIHSGKGRAAGKGQRAGKHDKQFFHQAFSLVIRDYHNGFWHKPDQDASMGVLAQQSLFPRRWRAGHAQGIHALPIAAFSPN